MCTVSMVGDHYREKLTLQWPQVVQTWPVFLSAPVSREEFDLLRREVEDMKALLRRAKTYDDQHGESECQMEENVALLRRVAELVGIDLEDLLPAADAR